MSKLSKRDSTLLILIAMIGLIGGIFWFYVKPARADLTAKKEATQQAQEQVDGLQTELRRLTAQAAKPRKVDLSAELRLAKAYPYSEDIPVLILEIEALAKKSHVELGDLTPAASTDYAGVTGTPFTVDATGKFFDVQDFLYRMHNQVHVAGNGRLRISGRMLAVTKADLTPDDTSATTAVGSTSAKKNDKVKASVTIVAFSRTAGAAGTAGATTQPTSAAPSSTNSGGKSS